ncbi:TonB-dependent receptor plug domain-containing protein [Acetobacteraceae bacterium KSS8]|uniref:TonB-dependent receptor plug domain-containing protein n=1 Tax=Endosaccharibacter trunci TaxID=2812733 RepID=A0ABT1W7J5_9PROT|nr:TonB-dependent receptor plug domain-containing protein [Acetobacteraceae bacterium KSS8]
MVPTSKPKTLSEVTQVYISKQSPLLTPGALIANLAGVQSNNEGPISTTADILHVRGFDQTQIAMVYEGMPLADPFTYGAYTASMVDDENLASVKLQQGSADLTAPTYNAVGGQMTLSLRQPAAKPTFYVEGSGGTKSTNKEFVRADTGEIGHSGIDGFVSGSYSSGNLWRGPGSLDRWHIDAAARKNWTDQDLSEMIFGLTRANQTEWLYPTLAQWRAKGTGFYTDPTYKPGDVNFYKINTKATNATLGAIKNHFALSNGFSLDLEPYGVETYGPNNYGASIPIAGGYLGTERYASLDGYPATPGTITAISIHPWWQLSSGVNMVGSWARGPNVLSLSYWYSYVVHTEIQYHYPLDAFGQYTRNNPYLTVFGGMPVTQYDINGVQQLNALGLDDRLSLLGDRLTIDAGLRANMLGRQITENLPGSMPYKSVKNIFEPVPQILISYRITPSDQIYVNGTTGYRTPAAFQAQVPIYSFTTGLPTSVPLHSYVPEYMIGEEAGFRHEGPLNLNLAAFHYNLVHYQINSVSYLPGTSILVSQPIDAGGEEAEGAQAELATRPWHHFSAYVSGQFLHTTIGNNIAFGGDTLPTRGKTEVASPKLIASTSLTYDDTVNFGTLSVRYSDAQYSTLMNDQGMPAFFGVDASIGRTLPTVGRAHPKLMLSLLNIGDIHSLTSVNGFTVASRPTKGLFGNTVAGSQPNYVIGTGFAAIATLSATIE